MITVVKFGGSSVASSGQFAKVKNIIEKDQKRKVYYKNYTGRQWGQAPNYALCLNSGILGLETCVDIIVQAAK